MEVNSQLTFLLVDNELSRLDKTGGFLQEMGHFNFLEAEDGQEAWSLVNNFDVDFIVCNMDISEINGMALLKVIRSNEEYADIPFVLLGDKLTAGLVSRAGRAGVSDIVVLPMSEEVFKQKISEIIALEQEPQNQEAQRLHQQGEELMRAGRYEEALKSFESILSVHENAEVYYNMGYIKSHKGLWDEAIRLFRRATQIDNNYARAYKRMAEAYEKMGQLDAAKESLQKAAEIYLERKEDEEAEEALQGVLNLRP
ncbi:MAG: tetratricopeptide repeat protein, partial [Thermodesulfobacteriota bacterium]